MRVRVQVNGSWVLLQNCELGLPLMDQMEEIMLGMKDTVHADFRCNGCLCLCVCLSCVSVCGGCVCKPESACVDVLHV